MNFITNKSDGNKYINFAAENQLVQPSFENKVHKCKTNFTHVAAIGKSKKYSRLEKLQGWF